MPKQADISTGPKGDVWRCDYCLRECSIMLNYFGDRDKWTESILKAVETAMRKCREQLDKGGE